ncbi:MAG: DNA repair helicase XPB [bacterium]
MSKPLLVQTDGILLADSESEEFASACEKLSEFARLEETQGRWHKYNLDRLSLWSASGAGKSPEEIIDWLENNSKTSLNHDLRLRIKNVMNRYGKVRMFPADPPPGIKLVFDDSRVHALLEDEESLPLPPPQQLTDSYALWSESERGLVKQYLAREGWPVVDLVGYEEGTTLPVELAEEEFELRDYQQDAVDAYLEGERKDGGSGVILLPCGGGKTIVGLALMAHYGASTLVICTHRTARNQWKEEILEKTTVTEEMICEYTGRQKEIKPITLTTYNMLTYRDEQQNRFIHMDLFNRANWGLIIYDEVHLLPAPVFRATADIQSRRRLGLTATLVREDERETDVFSLIGPRRYECPWLKLTERGWISPAICREIRIPAAEKTRRNYNKVKKRRQHKVAARNPRKLEAIEKLLDIHPGGKILIIGYYLDFLKKIQDEFDLPLITGETPMDERLDLYDKFREGEIKGLILSKVGNYSVDLPNANVMVQVSGTFGSRQEEAQRLGRLLRPNPEGKPSLFYTLVTGDTVEVEFARRRKLFLLRQGYQYETLKFEELCRDNLPLQLAGKN